MTSDYKCTSDLKEGDSTSVMQKQMPSQREQYRSNVHLFIGTGRSPCKITLMPLTFANKSVPLSAIMPKVPREQLRSRAILRTSYVLLHVVVLTHVRRYLFTHYTPETLLNHVFEDLRKPKAPNSALGPFLKMFW
jgi:hypothetical protein